MCTTTPAIDTMPFLRVHPFVAYTKIRHGDKASKWYTGEASGRIGFIILSLMLLFFF